jgi:dTDP-glucose 4,6-dehydratase
VARLLVTGGAGFIGANFVRYWSAHHPGDRVVVLDALTYAGNRASLPELGAERLRFEQGDIRDRDLVARLLREEEIDTLVHFAAESHVDRSIASPEPFIEVNVLGTLRLLEAARDVWLAGDGRPHRFHHVSTDEVYGSLAAEAGPFTETTPYAPNSPYAASKAAADHLVRAYRETYGLATTISNCSNNYGPYQHVEKFIPRQITNVIDGVRPKLYGSGQNVRDWIHADDHSAAVLLIAEQGTVGETYLIGAEGEHDNREVVETILELMGRPVDEYDLVNDRPGHDLRYAIDPSKLRRELGWTPHFADFRAGLAQTIDWYRSHEQWWRPHKRATEDQYARQGQ